MSPEERLKKYQVQTDDLYRAIGKFTVKFEHVVFSMRTGITFFLHFNGLKNQQLAHIILSDLTAYPVKSIFGSMIPAILKLKDKEKKIVKAILNRTQKLIDLRNDIVHSVWFVGWANPQDADFSKVSGHKLTRGKKGSGVKGFDYKSVDFDRLSNECDSVNELIKQLSGTIFVGHEISKNFELTDTGEVTVPKKLKKSSSQAGQH